MAPGGTGNCSLTQPCGSLASALVQAGSGSTVLVAPGTYGAQVLPARAAARSFAQNVTIQPSATGVSFGAIRIDEAHLTIQDVTATGQVYVATGADYTQIHRLVLTGNGMFIHASHVQLTDSTITNGTAVDGLQIAGTPNTDILVARNNIHGFVQTSTAVHVDCMQLFDVNHVTIVGNNFGDCHNAGIIFSPGRKYGVSNVLVQSNFIQGCVPNGPVPCVVSTAFDLRYAKVTNVTVDHNTFPLGAVRINPNPGVIVTNNIIGYLAQCNSPVTDSLVSSWNYGVCRVLPAKGTSRQGTPGYVDPAASNFHLVTPSQAGLGNPPFVVRLFPAGPYRITAGVVSTGVDIDGQPLTSTPGADD